MNQYEVMYVIDTAIDDQARSELIARFSGLVAANGGTVDRVDEWGKRRLAYAINYKTEGYYVLMYVTAPSEFPREMERNLQINDNVLRYLVIRFEGELPPKREPLKPYAAKPEAASPVVEAAPAPEAEPAAEAPAEETPVAVEAAAEETPAGETAPAAEETPAE